MQTEVDDSSHPSRHATVVTHCCAPHVFVNKSPPNHPISRAESYGDFLKLFW